MARRGNGEGSYYQRPDGIWVGTVRLGPKRLYRYGKTRSEAFKKLQTVLQQHHQGTLTQPTKITLREWVDQWLSGLELRPSTTWTYRQSIGHVLKEVGEIRLDRLTPPILSDTFARLARKKVGSRRLYLAHGYLKACLQNAVDLELLPRNSMERVRRPRWEPRPKTYWTIDQAARFLRTCESSHLGSAPLFIVLATSGLRISEALALTWEDVNLEHVTLDVSRALVWSGGHYTVGAVKTRKSLRRVSIPLIAVRVLERLAQGTTLQGRIFATSSGEPPSLSNLRRSLLKLCAEAKVPPTNVHGLRHVAAALAFRATGDPYAVQHRLGHSHISVTLGIYGYGTRSDQSVAEAVDLLLDDTVDSDAEQPFQT
jgi:integrase